jgi:hypothetical protein
VCLSITALRAATEEELRAEIRDLKAKISQTRKRTEETRAKAGKDREAYDAYTAKHGRHVAAQRAEVDSLKRTHARLQVQADSLAGAIRDVRARQRGQTRRQDGMIRSLAFLCDSLVAVVKRLPPSNVTSQLGALQFLGGELASGAVDNVEAVERMWQIMDALERSAQSVEVYTGPSPVPEIPGQVSFIRLGHAYLALVDDKGSAAAVWTVGDSAGAWLQLDDPAQRAALRQCVRIRQGGAVPQLVDMPFAHAIQSDTLSFQGGGR